MTETAKLVIAVDSSGAAKATANLDKLDRAAGNSERAANKLGKAWGAAIGLISSAVIIGATRSFIRQADAMANLSAKLKLVTGDTQKAAAAQKDLFELSQRTSSDLESTTELYVKLGQSSKALAGNHTLLLGVTEKVSKALVISGADAASSAAVIRKFSQAMAAGALRGDEFQSVMEGAPRLAQAIADGMGKPTKALRDLAEQGKLTSEVIIKALENQGAVLDREFGEMPVTVSRATTQVRNAIMAMVGDTNTATGATKDLANGILALARTLESEEVKRGFQAFVGGVTAAVGALAKRLALTANLAKFMGEEAAARIGGPSADDTVRIQQEIERQQARIADALAAAWKSGLKDPESSPGVKAAQKRLSELQAMLVQSQVAAVQAPSTGRFSAEYERASLNFNPNPKKDAPEEDKATKSLKSRTKARKELTIAEQEALLMAKSLTDADAENFRLRAEGEQAAIRAKEATANLIEDMQFELSLIGLSNVEREKAIALRYAGANAASAEGQAVGKLAEKLARAREAEGYKDDLKAGLSDLFMSIENGSDAASAAIDRMIDNLKRRALDALADNAVNGLIAAFASLFDGGGWAGFKSGFSSGWGGGRAGGGPVMSGQSYWVGEDGRELFTPATNGTVSNGGGGVTVKPQINVRIEGAQGKAEVTQQENQSGGFDIKVMFKQMMNQGIAKGDFDRAFSQTFGLQRQGVVRG